MNPIGIAVIGYGYWGPNLVRNFQGNENARMLCVCDGNTERLAKARKQYPHLATTTRFQEVLDDAAVQGVVVATPPGSHFELVKAALEHGKHVLVEKPFTTRFDHAEELCALAKAKGLTLQVDHVFVYSQPVQKMRELVVSGKLGNLYFIDSVRINLGLIQRDVNVLWDLAPHDLSIVDYLVGRPPVSLSCVGGMHVGDGVEDVAYLNLDYGDGLLASFHVNWLSPVKVRHMIVGGSKQSIIYDDNNVGEKVKVYDRGVIINGDLREREKMLVSYRSGDVWSPSLGNAEALASVVADFLTAISEGKEPLSNGAAGLRIVKILEASQRSMRLQGTRVAL